MVLKILPDSAAAVSRLPTTGPHGVPLRILLYALQRLHAHSTPSDVREPCEGRAAPARSCIWWRRRACLCQRIGLVPRSPRAGERGRRSGLAVVPAGGSRTLVTAGTSASGRSTVVRREYRFLCSACPVLINNLAYSSPLCTLEVHIPLRGAGSSLVLVCASLRISECIGKRCIAQCQLRTASCGSGPFGTSNAEVSRYRAILTRDARTGHW